MPALIRKVLLLSCSIAVFACDKEADDPPANTTTTMGMDGSEGQDGQDSEGEQGCVPPNDGFVCSTDEQCAIAGDCCGCIAYTPANSSPGNCGGFCEMDKCEEWGVSEAACVDNRCVPRELSCNQALVICKALPPECEPGFLPRVWDGCWVGDCLPIEACDWAPDCDACAPGDLCMHELRGGCDFVRCVEPIAECEGAPACCTGEIWCDAECTPTADGFACG